LALASGLAFAIVVLSMRRLRTTHPIATACILNSATAAVLAPLVLLRGRVPASLEELVDASWPTARITWSLLIAMGVFQMAAPYWLFARALRQVPAATASLITLCEPLLNTLWTYLWIDERPVRTTLIGGGLILGGLLLKNRLDRRAFGPRPAEAT